MSTREAAAQVYHPQAFEHFESAPALALQLSPSSMRSLQPEFDDLHSLDAFGGKRRIDPFSQSVSERPEPWTLFGRLGVLKPGAFAGLLLVDGDPLEDLGVLGGQGERLDVIVRGGVICKNALH